MAVRGVWELDGMLGVQLLECLLERLAQVGTFRFERRRQKTVLHGKQFRVDGNVFNLKRKNKNLNNIYFINPPVF